MGTRKINRKKNFTQGKKYKKRGNKLLNTQKKIRKQSKNKRQLKKPVKKKQTFKIIKCPKCKGVKQLKISKKKIDRLKNAGLSRDDIYKALTGAFCCCNVFGSTLSEEYNEHDLHRRVESRRQNIINLRNRPLSSSSVISDSSTSYETANEGSQPSYILVEESPNREKQRLKYTRPKETNEGSLEL